MRQECKGGEALPMNDQNDCKEKRAPLPVSDDRVLGWADPDVLVNSYYMITYPNTMVAALTKTQKRSPSAACADY